MRPNSVVTWLLTCLLFLLNKSYHSLLRWLICNSCSFFNNFFYRFDYRSTNRVYAISKCHLRMAMACVVKYSKVFFRGVVIDVNDDFVEVSS